MLKQMLMGLTLFGAVMAQATEGVSDMAVQLFGKEAAEKRVSTGVVFIDGLYIKAPYSVTREGNVILINGQIASRFKVESAMAGAIATAKEAAKNDPAMQEGVVSETAGATIGSDDTPTIATPKPGKEKGARGPTALEEKIAKQYANGTGLEAKLAAQKRAKELKEASGKGSFNSASSGSGDAMALFEEADYTYTPPAKPEPKAVPYIRPAAKESFAERAAKNKARADELAAQAKAAAAGNQETEAAEDEIATEDFENLSEEEIADITKRASDRRAQLEKLLGADSMIFLSASTSAAKVEKKASMQRFVLSLEKLCAASSADALVKQWGKSLPAGYLRKIYDNRATNAPEMKTLLLRVNREVKEAKERASRRL